MEKLFNKLDDLILCITDSYEYKQCIFCKEKMASNSELIDLINQMKLLQKKYVNSNYNPVIKEKLDNINLQLNSIPIYNTYLSYLEKVNYKIDYVKDFFNNYFYDLLNKKY